MLDEEPEKKDNPLFGRQIPGKLRTSAGSLFEEAPLATLMAEISRARRMEAALRENFSGLKTMVDGPKRDNELRDLALELSLQSRAIVEAHKQLSS